MFSRAFSDPLLHNDWVLAKNKGDTNDGIGMRPDHVRAGLESKTPSAFLHFPIKRTKAIANRAGAPILMNLSHGGLKHLTTTKAFQKDDDVESAVAPRTLPNWCQYRFKKLIGVWTERCDKLVHITSIIAKAFSKPVGTFVASCIVERQGRNDSCATQTANRNGRNQMVFER